MGTLNNTNKLPECPEYVAHPQSVWFEEHWRPALAAKDAEIERLNKSLNAHRTVVELKDNRISEHLRDKYTALAAKDAEISRLKNELADKDAVLEWSKQYLAEVTLEKNLKFYTPTEKVDEVLQKYRKSEG